MSQWHYRQIFLHTDSLADADYPHLVALGDAVLIEAIAPVLQRFAPMIASSFFLRYNEAGYHLRLRIKADPHAYRQHIDPALTEALMTFREATPLLRRIEAQAFLQAAEYEPETDKYGGQDGIAQAEAHFARASAVALQILRLEHEKRIPRALVAFVIMRALIDHLLPHPMQAALFVLAYMRYWLIGKDEDQSLLWLRQHATEKRAILAQADKFVMHPQIQAWISDLQTTLTPFLRLEDEARLQTAIHPHLQQQATRFTPTLSHPITTLLIMPNFIHLLHNRLGISTIQETQVAGILYFNHLPPATEAIPLVLEPLAFDWLAAYYGLPPL